MHTKPTFDLTEKNYVYNLQKQYQEMFPETLSNLKNIDKHFAQKRVAKGYSLAKIKNTDFLLC
jgi:hypothetical protein